MATSVVDTGTNDSVEHLLDALREKGRTAEDIAYVFLTHVHLDHAGGAGLLMRAARNAMLAPQARRAV